MKLNKLVLTLIAGSLFFVSCDDNEQNNNTPKGAYDNGVIVLNQGGFGHGDAGVSFIANDFTLENNVYAANNPGFTLGDTGQDIGLNDDYAYVVLNYSNKIEVVNRYTFKRVASIETELENPRYIAFQGGKAYVTNWGNGSDATDDYVAVINLATNTVTGKIPVTEGPERILEENGKLYVAHKGGYGYGNKISVINGGTNTVETTITVGDVPDSMEIENGKLYVLNSGKSSWSGSETAGSLSVINLSNNTVTSTLNFASATHPSNLVENNGTLYYTIDANIYSMSVTATALPTTPLFSTTAQGVYGVYAFAVENNHIYVGDAGDYSSAGKVYVYSLTGTKEHDYTVGVVPAGFYFN